MPEYSPQLGRLHRASQNHREALILFPAAAVVARLSETYAFTAARAWTFLAVRALYIPATWRV